MTTILHTIAATTETGNMPNSEEISLRSSTRESVLYFTVLVVLKGDNSSEVDDTAQRVSPIIYETNARLSEIEKGCQHW